MKTSQTDTEKRNKMSQTFRFSKILGFLSNFSTDFVDWNIEKGEQGKHLLSSSRYKEFIAFL